MVSVFLSHSSKDKPFVRNLADALEAGGEIKAWLDEREINYGDNIVRKIEEGLDADFVLLILSPDSVDSKWVREERTDAFWEQVNEDRIKLGIVLYRDCTIPRLLRNKLYFDLRADHPEGFRKIRTWLLGHRPAPPPIVHLPQKSPLFIGRQPELAALRTRLQQEGSVVYIPGTPGRGKTTLALHFAHLYQRDFEAVHWLPCQSRSLAQIAAELTWQFGLKLDGDLDTILRELTAHCARKRCLLILDNVDDEAPARLLPGGRTSVLITTRRNDLDFLSFHRSLDLPLFSEPQCFELFREVIGAAEVDRHTAEAHAIFVRLDHLPIGIAVAAKLIRKDVRYTIAGMAKNLPAGVTALLAEAIAALTPTAQTLLAAMAACAPEGFRLTLAAEVAELDEQSSLDALYEIYARSLADELDRDTHRYRLHALVREAANPTDAHHVRHAEAINEQFEGWETNWRQCEQDMADWQTAFTWSLDRPEDKTWFMAKKLANSGFRLTNRLGRLSEAYEALTRVTSAADFRKDKWALQACYGNQAVMLKNWGQLDAAMSLHKREEAICTELGNKTGLSACYGNQATILKNWGRLNIAMTLHKKAEALCIEVGNKIGLSACYGSQAVILREQGKLEDAMALHKKEEANCIELDDKTGLSACYGNQALILKDQGKLEDAMALHEKEEALCIEMGNKAGLQDCYGNQAAILKARGQLNAAMALLKKVEAISTELGNKAGLSICYCNQALIARAWGQFAEATALHERQETICTELGDRNGLAYCYWNWGLLVRAQGDDTEAEKAKLEQALTLFTELGMPLHMKAVQAELDQTNAITNPPP